MSARALRAALAVAVALVLGSAATAVTPARAATAKPDLSGAASAILIDARDGSVITAKDPRERRPMASTTKLMTALLTLERSKPDQVFAASNYRPAAVESQIGLRPGERMRVSDLFEGLMLESANDAAETLAEGVGGSRSAFVAAMNVRARQLGLRDTSYGNPIGLDDPRTYTSARDLAMLGRRLMRDRRFSSVVGQTSATLESGAHRRVVDNRNDLVGRYPYVKGIKTGHTKRAGYVLVGAATSAAGAKVVSVVMGEPGEAARDTDSLALLRYGLSRFTRRKVLDADRTVARVAVAHRDGRAALAPASDALVLARRGDRIRTRVDAPSELGKTPAGTRVGTVAVVQDGEVVRRVPLTTVSDVPGAGPVRVVVHALGLPLTLLVSLLIVSAVLLLVTQAKRRRRHRELADRRRERRRARAQAEGASE